MFVTRLILAAWIAVFASQSADLFAFLVTDDCVESTAGVDPCPDNCARCVCCAPTTVLVPPTELSAPLAIVSAVPLAVLDHLDHAHPRGIFHVPKPSLT